VSASATLVHATRGRARLRLPSAKGDAAFFRRLEEELRNCVGVTDVKVNARTGSVLVRHGGDLDVVARHARAHGLFDLREREERDEQEPRTDEAARAGLSRHARALDEIENAIRDADKSLRRRTNGAVDLQALAFGALVGGSAYQLVRGKFLPAGGTMLVQALSLLFGSARGED
jgi:hypothetical protein